MTAVYAIGVDLGGTRIRAALVSREGAVAASRSLPTPIAAGSDAVLHAASGLIARMLLEAQALGGKVCGIGIGSAGQISAADGRVAAAADTMPGWAGTPLQTVIQARFPALPVRVDNDVNALAFAEQWYGAGRNYDNFLCVALGTGIGGAIVANRRLLKGSTGAAGEFGHTSVDRRGPLCGCGNRGCLEMYASGSGMARLAREALASRGDAEPERLARYTARELLADWQAGDPLAAATMDVALEALGTALAGHIRLFDPEAIIIGGGIADAGEPLLAAIRRETYRRAPDKDGSCAILPAAAGSRAGVVGAAVQIWAIIAK